MRDRPRFVSLDWEAMARRDWVRDPGAMVDWPSGMGDVPVQCTKGWTRSMRLTRASVAAAGIVVAAAAAAVVGVVILAGDDGGNAVEGVSDDGGALVTALAAERWSAAPSAESLRSLFEAVGGNRRNDTGYDDRRAFHDHIRPE